MSNLIFNNQCEILMRRFSSNSVCTRGELMIGSTKLQTLEPSKPIIPDGTYLIRLSYSPTFSKKYPYTVVLGGKVPEIIGIEGHSGLRIHVGNYPSDTKGCILVGLNGTDCSVLNSSLAYRYFCSDIQHFSTENPNIFFTIRIYTES